MLTFPEEVMLLLLDDKGGSFFPVPDLSLHCALAGAVLMELALADRIDTDVQSLMLVDDTPTGDPLLDPTLKRIAAAEEARTARFWVETASADAEAIRDEALARLVEKGILERSDDRFLWMLDSRGYPIVDGDAEKEVKLRIMEILTTDELPDPRDIVIIALCNHCGLFQAILPSRRLDALAKRIEQISALDLIGQAVGKSVADIQQSIEVAGRLYG